MLAILDWAVVKLNTNFIFDVKTDCYVWNWAISFAINWLLLLKIKLIAGHSGKKLLPYRIGTGWNPWFKAKLSGATYDFKEDGNIVSKGGWRSDWSILEGIVYP